MPVVIVAGLLVGFAALSAASAATYWHFAGKSIGDAVGGLAESIVKAATGAAGYVFISAAQRKKAEDELRAQMSRAAGSQIGVLARWHRSIDYVTRDIAGAVASYAAAATGALEWQGRVEIPGAKRRIGRLEKRVGIVAGAAAAAAGAIDRFRRSQDRRDARQDARSKQIDNAAGRASREAAKASGKAQTATGRARSAQRTANRALTRTRASVFAGTLATVMVGRLGFKWWRCSNFRRLGRALNCTHWAFLADLFALAIPALLITDVCRVSDAMNRVAGGYDATIVRPLVGVTDLVCRSGGGTMPSAVEAGGYSGAWLPSAS